MLQNKKNFQNGAMFNMAEFNWVTQEELEAEAKKKPQITILEETQSDLIFTLMMNGVI